MSDLQAAPPDAGGHLGVLTRPKDILMRPSAAQRVEPSPPLHRMHTARGHRVRSMAPMLAIGGIFSAWLVAFVLGLVPVI